jgi:hypothetical protein
MCAHRVFELSVDDFGNSGESGRVLAPFAAFIVLRQIRDAIALRENRALRVLNRSEVQKTRAGRTRRLRAGTSGKDDRIKSLHPVRAVLIISDRWQEIADGMTKGNNLGVTLIRLSEAIRVRKKRFSIPLSGERTSIRSSHWSWLKIRTHSSQFLRLPT